MTRNILSRSLRGDYHYSLGAIASLVQLQKELLESDCELISLRIRSHYICPALFPLVWALPYCGLLINKRIILKHKKTTDRLSQDVVLYGVDSHFLSNKGSLANNCFVPFCYAPTLDDSIALHIQNIVNRLPVKNVRFRDAISSQITEAFSNAYEHGANMIGSFFNSYYDEKEKRFKFTIYDLGDGFIKKIKSYNSNKLFLTGSDAIEWALTSGNTTEPKDYPRGIGYTVLQNFAQNYNGSIFLCTDNYICSIDNNGKNYTRLDSDIRGTFFSMDIGL